MKKDPFMLRVSNRTFEYFSGHGYLDEGGSPERLVSPDAFWSLHLSVSATLYDDAGKPIGIRFRNRESNTFHDVYPGKVYNIPVWTTAVDDDGCPEDICIDFYLEVIPTELL